MSVIVMAALCLTWTAPSMAETKDNLLANPDLSQGTDGTPDYWHREAYVQANSQLTWIASPRPGQLEVSNTQLNDARWDYDFHLDPGWYHFTASVSTKNVPPNIPGSGVGAGLCIMEDGICSQLVYGTSDWQTVGLYVKVGDSGADGMLACRLGGYSAVNTGSAFCKDIAAVQVSGPNSQDGDPVFDLDVVRGPTPALTPCQP